MAEKLKDQNAPAQNPETPPPVVKPGEVVEEIAVGERVVYFMVTDRASLNKGYVKVPPVPMAIPGRGMTYLGNVRMEIEDGIASTIDDGTLDAQAAIKSANRLDGILELTDKVVERIVRIGLEMGVIEGDDGED